MRIIIVVGARPNFIKVAPLMPALAAGGHRRSARAHRASTTTRRCRTCSSATSRSLQPTWFLGVGSGTHAVQTGKAMVALEELLVAEEPDALMVVGDVNSTLAGALAAAKIHVPVVHLEAGLRSGDMSMPEEVNRLVTDQLSAMLLTPTEGAEANLVAEGVDGRAHPLRRQHHGRVRPREHAPDRRPRRGAAPAASRAEGLRARHHPPAREHGPPRAARRDRGRADRVAAAGRLPGAPANAGAASPSSACRSRAGRSTSSSRSATSTCSRCSATPPRSSPTPAACRRRRACSARRA